MVKFICYPKCTTCQKARKWLDDNNIEYEMSINFETLKMGFKKIDFVPGGLPGTIKVNQHNVLSSPVRLDVVVNGKIQNGPSYLAASSRKYFSSSGFINLREYISEYTFSNANERVATKTSEYIPPVVTNNIFERVFSVNDESHKFGIISEHGNKIPLPDSTGKENSFCSEGQDIFGYRITTKLF